MPEFSETSTNADPSPACPPAQAPAFTASRDRFEKWRLQMTQAQGGDDQAYHALLLDLAKWLRVYCRRRLHTHFVDDVVQETLIAVHVARERYNPERAFGPWVATIARRECIDARRRDGRHAAAPLDEAEGQAAIADHGDKIISSIVVNKTLARLKPAQATAIRLVKLQGASIEEVSRLTGQSASLVRVNVHRGLHRMADILHPSEPA